MIELPCAKVGAEQTDRQTVDGWQEIESWLPFAEI